MPVSVGEMREDVRKVRLRKYLYFLGGLGIFGLAVALVVIFFVRRDWPALLLAGVGAFWSVMLLYHAYRSRELEHLIAGRLMKADSACPREGEGSGPAAADPVEETGETPDVSAEDGEPGEP